MDDEPSGIIFVEDDPPAVQRRGPKLGGRALPHLNLAGLPGDYNQGRIFPFIHGLQRQLYALLSSFIPSSFDY